MLTGWNVADLSRALAAGELSASEVTESYLGRIEAENPRLNAYISVLADQARAAARQSDARRSAGEGRGALDGVPLAIKDNICFQETKTTAGSRILAQFVAPRDATVIARLKQAGLVPLGKTNMDEFAMGSSTERSAFGPTKNPVDESCVPGGSSGGSAAAVAADLAPAALGSDTGGSIRQPAAFCGLVGFKPTYGTVSRSGLIAMASSFDQIGPMTKTVEDAALLFNVLRGPDPADLTTTATAVSPFTKDASLRGVRIGLPRQAWAAPGLSPAVRFATEQAVEALRALGADVREVDLPYADEALAVYYVLVPAEISANLSRLDGIRFGDRRGGETLAQTYALSRGEGLGDEVRRRILLGTYTLSKGYVDAYYRQARRVRRLIASAYDTLLQEVDLLVTPTAPTTAFKIGEKLNDPLAMYLEDVFTVGINVAGVPAISIPCGREPGTNLPIGIQLIGRRFDDGRLLSFAHAYERV